MKLTSSLKVFFSASILTRMTVVRDFAFKRKIISYEFKFTNIGINGIFSDDVYW